MSQDTNLSIYLSDCPTRRATSATGVWRRTNAGPLPRSVDQTLVEVCCGAVLLIVRNSMHTENLILRLVLYGVEYAET